jgi:hypothetical protein
MIKRVAGGYQVVSEKGKNLGGPSNPKKKQKNACAKSNTSNTTNTRRARLQPGLR